MIAERKHSVHCDCPSCQPDKSDMERNQHLTPLMDGESYEEWADWQAIMGHPDEGAKFEDRRRAERISRARYYETVGAGNPASSEEQGSVQKTGENRLRAWGRFFLLEIWRGRR